MTHSNRTDIVDHRTAQPDLNYSTRAGYNPHFLGFPVPLPLLTPRIRRFALTNDQLGGLEKVELQYEHFSVIMNRSRRLAFVAGVNYDASARFTYSRDEKDAWFYDPRIPKDVQAGERYYTNNMLDRGHLVRRQDAAWGNSLAEAKRANNDTFHFTNCSPQHAIFNQSGLATQAGIKLWGNLENYIAKQARKDKQRLCIFNGPIFGRTDRIYRALPGSPGLRIPRAFWKVVVFDAGDNQATAVAFVLSQRDLIADLPERGITAGEFQTFQVTVNHIEQVSKLGLGFIRPHDRLQRVLEMGAFTKSLSGGHPLSRLEDIVV